MSLENIDKLIVLVSKIKTPLILSGLVVIVMYYTYKQILSSGLLSKLGEGNTFLLLDKILNVMFYLAILSIILGAGCYLVSILITKSEPKVESIEAKVELLDSDLIPANADREFKAYVESIKNDKGIIIDGHRDNEFPKIDFKFRNKGMASGFLWKYKIIIIDSKAFEIPSLKFDTSVDWELSPLIVKVKNEGGIAHDCVIDIEEPSINKVFPNSATKFEGDIPSGVNKEIIKISSKNVDKTALKLFFLLPHTNMLIYQDEETGKKKYGIERWYDAIKKAFENYQIKKQKIIHTIKIKWSCKDEIGYVHKGNVTEILTNWGNGFGYDTLLTCKGDFIHNNYLVPVRCEAHIFADAVYCNFIKPTNKPYEKVYSVSRKIPNADIDRFKVMLISPVSGYFRLKFQFFIDKKVLESDEIEVYIHNPDKDLHKKYNDSQMIYYGYKGI